MKRGAIVFAIVAVLVIADGWYLIATNNNVGGDTGSLFGNPHFFLSAGQETLIAGVALLVGAGIMWAVALRRARAAGGIGRVSKALAGEGEARAEAGAAADAGACQGESEKELSDQRES